MFLGLGVVLAGLLVPSAASASSGQITRALANPEWTLGSFAMSVTFTECPAMCGWRPLATVQPTLPSYNCTGAEAFDSDPNTVVVWSGAQQTANGTVGFDQSNVPILPNVVGQRLCVSAIRQTQVTPLCEREAVEKGQNPQEVCPKIGDQNGVTQALSSALLAVGPFPAQLTAATLKFGKVKLNKQRGTATLPVTVPGAGQLSVGGKGVVKKRPGLERASSRLARQITHAGTYTLKVKAKGRKKAKLFDTGKVKVKAVVTFKPTSGDAVHRTKKITLKKS
jgi:hypothetical protein